MTVGPGRVRPRWPTNWSESRRSSVVVVDEAGPALGRILADDVIDALLPERAAATFHGCCSDAPGEGRAGEARPDELPGGPPAPGRAGPHCAAAPPRWSGGSRRPLDVTYLALAGPGIIAANAGNDAGGIVTYAVAGAQYAYRTLFFMLLVTVALVVVQEMAARLGTFTGKGLAALIREEFTLRPATFALVCLVLANVGLVVSEFAGIGAALRTVRCQPLHLHPASPPWRSGRWSSSAPTGTPNASS